MILIASLDKSFNFLYKALAAWTTCGEDRFFFSLLPSDGLITARAALPPVEDRIGGDFTSATC